MRGSLGIGGFGRGCLVKGVWGGGGFWGKLFGR